MPSPDITSPDVALVTCAEFPNGYDDDKILAAALVRLGAKVAFVCWDDPAVQWPALDLAVIRSTWDYYLRIDAFLGWVDYVDTATRLVNDARTIRWNAHKGYLLELASAGVPVVPTALLRKGEAAALPDGEWVVKPAVSAGAHLTVRGATQADLDDLLATTDVLLQPYVRDIEAGETSIICVGGTPTHASLKVPAEGDFRTQEHLGAVHSSAPISEAHAALARGVLALLPTVPAYARVDVVDTPDGPLLMELELIEPALWFVHQPAAADTLATLLLATLG